MKNSPIIPGFLFAGIRCGIKKYPKKDLGVIFSQTKNTTIAGVFTQNKIQAAPVKLCRKNVSSGKGRLVVINSGIANAATGRAGLQDARTIQKFAARQFGIPHGATFICSTGRIGVRVPVEKIKMGFPRTVHKLDSRLFSDCAQAIMTTDAYPKTAWTRGRLGGKAFTIAVMAKGAGMICPDMATLLCFVMTDLNIPPKVLKRLLKECADETLNCLSVDGDTSTNDTVLILANGLCGNKPFRWNSTPYLKIKKILMTLLHEICLKIVLDGEGATKCAHIIVTGALSAQDARLAARAVANSLLVKTALFGSDPNWGRVLCAAGYSGARVKEEWTSIKIGPHTVFSRGQPVNRNEKKAAVYLRKKIVSISVHLGMGQGRARMYASDLSCDYVRLNADYRT